MAVSPVSRQGRQRLIRKNPFGCALTANERWTEHAVPCPGALFDPLNEKNRVLWARLRCTAPVVFFTVSGTLN